MSTKITIAGQEITLNEHPKHKTVQSVQDIMTAWMMEMIDMDSVDQDMPLEAAIKDAIMKNPKLAADITPMQRTLPFDQTIMLATDLTYKELKNISDEMTEPEYRELHEAAKAAIGGTAADFFEYYNSSMFGKIMTMPAVLEQFE